jgi:hypothetical protein
MAYTTTNEVKRYLGITSDDDNDLVADFITAAMAMIDNHTGYTFEAATDAARTFDAVADVEGAMLYVDPLAAITSITNGDGTTVTSGQYTTQPRRFTPYYAIKLLSSSNVSWTYTTDPENAISITGRWAYSTTAPAPIAQACKRLAGWLYRQKDTNADTDRPILAGDGNVIMPSRMPNDITAILNEYRRPA